jgi:hypothetical protein
MRVGLVASVGVALVIPWLDSRWILSIFVVFAGMAFGMFWAPSMAMLSDGWEAAGVGHGLGFALMNFAWAPGHAVGSAVGGGIADVASDALAYGLLAALCMGTLLALQGAFRRPVTAMRAAERG